MELNDVKDKIKKLLALHEDTIYDNESYVALQKAQELMAKYKLSKYDITDEEPQKCIRKKTTLSYGTRSSDHYMNELATIIADNFCCVNYVSTPRGSKTHYVCFMGMAEDVEIACEVLYTANAAIIRGYNRVWNQLCKEYGLTYIPAKYFNPAKLGYIEGYLAGLRSALDSQKEKNQEWGLVLVAPKEAQEFLGNLEKKSFSSDNVLKMDPSFYDEGYQDGSNFQLSKKLDSARVQEKLAE